ncbi:hypothetical protein BIM11_5980 [Burkholderia pseudomallei]|nr:hypothetical protein DO70_2291 [Burkholderia pseudomallei]KGW36447.1 hypothetical protein Y047_5519 [Burkholderia pseudomallei MSHR3016]OAG65075.1 hypothetical protein BIM11_5980 [Burkholderia pseudomallei]
MSAPCGERARDGRRDVALTIVRTPLYDRQTVR